MTLFVKRFFLVPLTLFCFSSVYAIDDIPVRPGIPPITQGPDAPDTTDESINYLSDEITPDNTFRTDTPYTSPKSETDPYGMDEDNSSGGKEFEIQVTTENIIAYLKPPKKINKKKYNRLARKARRKISNFYSRLLKKVQSKQNSRLRKKSTDQSEPRYKKDKNGKLHTKKKVNNLLSKIGKNRALKRSSNDMREIEYQAMRAGMSSFTLSVPKRLRSDQDLEYLVSLAKLRAERSKRLKGAVFNREELIPLNQAPNDPLYSDLWGLETMSVPRAWDFCNGNFSETLVAVIDSGIDYNHPDLRDIVWKNPGERPNDGVDNDGNGYVDDYFGYDFDSDDSDPFDDNSHGSHVSGTLGAKVNNSIGIAGVTPNVKIIAIDAVNTNGQLLPSSIFDSLKYATMMGAQVINMSFGGSVDYPDEREFIDLAHAAGITLVASAGNSGDERVQYPARYDNVISVAATLKNNSRAAFSTFGPWIDVAAPGWDILSTTPDNNYNAFNGTSMASPHVAGLAALMLSADPSLTNDQVFQIIKDTVIELRTLAPLYYEGFGLANAENAMREVCPGTGPAPTPVPQPIQPPGAPSVEITTHTHHEIVSEEIFRFQFNMNNMPGDKVIEVLQNGDIELYRSSTSSPVFTVGRKIGESDPYVGVHTITVRVHYEGTWHATDLNVFNTYTGIHYPEDELYRSQFRTYMRGDGTLPTHYEPGNMYLKTYGEKQYWFEPVPGVPGWYYSTKTREYETHYDHNYIRTFSELTDYDRDNGEEIYSFYRDYTYQADGRTFRTIPTDYTYADGRTRFVNTFFNEEGKMYNFRDERYNQQGEIEYRFSNSFNENEDRISWSQARFETFDGVRRMTQYHESYWDDNGVPLPCHNKWTKWHYNGQCDNPTSYSQTVHFEEDWQEVCNIYEYFYCTDDCDNGEPTLGETLFRTFLNGNLRNTQHEVINPICSLE